ncbi:hypothetical protein BD324DRAFT_583432 [Kockovaella imperatae]|uniref:DUF1275 domain protein n=1 Tax=Kockovaella imperatae TaxID=4999 RepID=A0A1Y1UAE6_9TREE|nr:hypothetical protein BD324DRAFT_583432 [Kockovaella imperatae]ORX34487.1 hypothetical protein BD324DRAFT_583432 [Kockovaella imperatae]
MISDSSASGHQARKGSSATLTHDTLTSYNRSGNPNPESLGQCLDDNEDRSFRRRIKSYSQAKVDLNAVNLICVYACFITGFTNAISFSACYVWAGFQSANVANLGLALARTFNPLPYGTRSFLKGDQQLLVSLVSFCIGTSLGRIGEHIGSTRRVWLVGATFCQLLLAVVGTCCAHFSGEKGIALDRGDPSWASPMGMSALGLISASMGLQGIIGKRLGSPMNSTVVLTTTWVELFNDPFLFAFRYAPSRDVRIGGILAVFVGAFCSRGLIATKCGMTGTLGIMIGLRGLQIVWFCFMREEKSSVESSEPSSKV